MILTLRVMNLKKGDTLVEVIVALAIFAITFISISTAFSAYINTYSSSNYKENNYQYSSSIAAKLKTIVYNNSGKLSDPASNQYSAWWFPFNNGSENSDQIMSDLDSKINFNSVSNSLIVNGTPITSNDDYNDFINNYYPTTNGYVSGALIIISNNMQSISNVKNYHVYVRVWNLQKKSSDESIKEFYIGQTLK